MRTNFEAKIIWLICDLDIRTGTQDMKHENGAFKKLV